MPQITLISVVKEAVKREASDIILSFGSPPMLKSDGKLFRLEGISVLNDQTLEGLVKEIVKDKAKLTTLDAQRQVDLAYAQDNTRFRVNIFYQKGHLSIVMRYIRSEIRKLDDLGLPDMVRDLLGNDNGLILVVGPTGSGKSTSLAAMIDYINENQAKHIITIEDPVEYVYENKQSLIQQREIGLDAVDFPSALRSALREAPDVILLGEMRDLESIAAAVTVAETGHLVLSTIHANNSSGTIDRIIDIFPAGYKDQIRIQLADILLAVFNQRLVPRADGLGNVVITEIMLGNSAVKNAIRSSNTAQLRNIIQTASGEGMFLLDDLLIKAAGRGTITKENALAYADDRESVRKGINIL